LNDKGENGNIVIVGNKIKLQKLGLVRFAKSREVNGRILNTTIRRNLSSKYFVSILCAEVEVQPEKTGSSVCVDVV
jgi:putative transposase